MDESRPRPGGPARTIVGWGSGDVGLWLLGKRFEIDPVTIPDEME